MIKGNFSDVAPILHESGWGAPIPSSPEGKGALLPGWSFYNANAALPESVEIWASRWPDANVALALSRNVGVVAVDIDIDDQNDADRVKGMTAEHLGHSDFIRVGRTPRQVRFYRCAPADPVPDVWRRGLEVKAGSGLITTHGWHAGVQRAYQWPIENILDALPTDLPLISSAQVRAFVKAATDSNVVGGFGGSDDSNACAADMLRALSGAPWGTDPLAFLADQLAGAVPGERHHRVLGAVVAAALRGFTDAEIEATFGPLADGMFGRDDKGSQHMGDALRWIRGRGVLDRNQTARMVEKRAPWARKVRSC